MSPEAEILLERVERILAARDDGTNRIEQIEGLIELRGWPPVQECVLEILADGSRGVEAWEVAAGVLWGAVCDRRAVDVAPAIAAVYHRLPPDLDSTENNLAWSLASALMKVGYLSDRDPLDEPGVADELARLRARDSGLA